jgi:hypothetical protein
MIESERKADPEPSFRDPLREHFAWEKRESLRQARARRHQATLGDYAP